MRMRKVLIIILCLLIAFVSAVPVAAQAVSDTNGGVSAMPVEPTVAGSPGVEAPAATEAAPAMAITSVEPSQLVNASPTTLSIYGSGFSASCVVRLVGYGLLSTTFINPTALTAQLPTGVPAGTYSLEVSNGQQTIAVQNVLGVTEPAPTPAPATPPPPPKPGQPILTVRNFTVEPRQVRAGEEFVVTIEIYNNGSRAGENTMAVFPGGTFVPVGETGHMIWQLHINHTAVVSQKMRTPTALGSGVHQLTISLSANDWEGNHYEYPTTVPVEVIGASQPAPPTGSPKIVIEEVTTEPAVLIPGEPFSLTLRLANQGRRTALNAFLGNGSNGLVLPARGGDVIGIEQIGVGEVVTATVGLVLDDAAEGGRQTLLVTLAYDDAGGGHYTDQQSVSLLINANLTTRPQLLLEACQTDPSFLTPGDSFTLTLTLTNVGGSAAERVMLALGGEGGANLAPFIPLNAGNVIFVADVAAGETVTVARELVIDGSAETKAHNLPVALSYDDPRGVRHSDAQRLSLLVRRRPRIQANFYQDPGLLNPGTETQLSLEVVNTGAGVINVLEIAAEGPGLTVAAAGLPFVGPLDPGGAAPVDLIVTPSEDSASGLTVALTYRDDLNQSQVVTTTLALEVSGGEPGGGPSPANPAPAQPGRGTVGNGATLEGLPAALAPIKSWMRVLRGILGFGS